MINPPIALYYMQGLNTTPVHGHAALFGVYGMLGIGLMLFSLRALDPVAEWKNGLLQFGFWATNSALMLMVALSLLPVGLMQTWASVETGYWYALSTEFLQTGTIQTFRWLRMIGDTIFRGGRTGTRRVCDRVTDWRNHATRAIPAAHVRARNEPLT